MAIIVEVLRPEISGSGAPGQAKVVEVIRGGSTPIETVSAQSTVEVVREGGTVANAQWGYDFPSNPHEGMIWINVTG